MWNTTVIESYKPLEGTNIEKLRFSGKTITDNALSFPYHMPKFGEFDFPTNLYTTEQVAWIVSNFPQLSGYALGARHDFMSEVPITIIVGKPSFEIAGNEERIAKHESRFEELKKQYKGKNYLDVFTVNPV